MFDVVLIPEAQSDLHDIFTWYEEQKEGLGFDFISSFETVLNKLSFTPFYASFIVDDARAAAIRKFPYHIIYRTDTIKQQVRIIAIVHQHRNPDWFKTRLV